MAEDINKKHTDANLSVRNAILEAIKANLVAEKAVNVSTVGSLAGAINALAATDLYSKGPPDNNYSKNSKREAFDRSEVIRNVEDIRGILKP